MRVVDTTTRKNSSPYEMPHTAGQTYKNTVPRFRRPLLAQKHQLLNASQNPTRPRSAQRQSNSLLSIETHPGFKPHDGPAVN